MRVTLTARVQENPYDYKNQADRIVWFLCAFIRSFLLWAGLVVAGWVYGADLHYPETLILFFVAILFSVAISVVPHPNCDWRRGND